LREQNPISKKLKSGIFLASSGKINN